VGSKVWGWDERGDLLLEKQLNSKMVDTVIKVELALD